MKTMSKLGLGVAVLTLVAGCGSENASHKNHAAANELNVMDNSMIVDPEIPNAAVEANGAAAEPEVEPTGTNAPAAVKVAPPPAPKAAAKADAPKAASKAAPKAAPKPEPSPPPKAECLPEHRAAGHC